MPSPSQIPDILLVAAGGALGAVARYLAVLLIKPHSPAFPTGTLLVNIAGCLLIGLIAGRLLPSPGAPLSAAATGRTWLFIAVGILGGFTTFSSFALESLDLVRAGRMTAAGTYIALSNTLGLAAAWLGLVLARAG